MDWKPFLVTITVLAAGAVSEHAWAEGAKPATLQELVVTAEKREQRLQDVPVAISAFTREKRERVGLDTLQDLSNFTPGLQYSASNDRVSLRGIGRTSNQLSTDAGVANYNDGVYETFALGAGRSTLFLERVEILRGPQGTLYGRNAIGGAINQISRRPTQDWNAEARAGLANYERYTLEGALSGPTSIPGVQFRLAGSQEQQRRGWFDNVVPGAPDEGGVVNQQRLEGQLQGAFLDGRLEIWLKATGSIWRNGAGGAGLSTEWRRSPDADWEYGLGSGVLNAGYGCSSNVTQVVNSSPLGCTNPQIADPRKIAHALPITVRLPLSISLVSEMTWHAPSLDIRSITGWTNYHYRRTAPTDTSPVVSYQLQPSGVRIDSHDLSDYRVYNRFWSQEFNVISTDAGPLQWVLGAYAFGQHYRQPVFVRNPQQPEWNKPLSFFPQVTCRLTGGVCAPPNDFRRYDDRPDIRAESWAGFGQADWRVAPAWQATVGLRYSSDRKYGSESVRALCFAAPVCYGGVPAEFFPFVFGGPPPAVDVTQAIVARPAGTPADPLPPGVTGVTTFDPVTGFATRRYDADWQAVTGTAGLEWRPSDAATAYAKFSRGYRSGGLNVGVVTAINATPVIGKELVDSYEVGLKVSISGRLQANLAAFDYRYKDRQTPLLQIAGTSGPGPAQGRFGNIPRSVSRGVELELTWAPVGQLEVLFNYSYLDAHITRGEAIDGGDLSARDPRARPLITGAQCDAAAIDADPTNNCSPNLLEGGWLMEQDLSGQSLPNSAKNKVALNVNYTWPRAFGGEVTVSASYLWRDKQYGNFFTRPYYAAPAWDQVDARLVWTRDDTRLRLILYVKNLFDSIGYDAGADGGLDGGFSIDPATGAVARSVIFTQSYSITPPRTFGIEVQRKFF